MKRNLIILFAISSLLVFSQKENAGKLLYSDNFNKELSNWTAEFEIPETSGLKLVDSKLDLVSSRGATVWFNKKLSGNIMITYDEVLIEAGGTNDRVSDMNVFWMATDPANPEAMIKRDGKFSSYDNLNLYYAGVGGHYNKFTRFRKYNSDGNKPVLKEYNDAAHLLVGNKKYSIKIIINNGFVQYYLNDELYWELKDETPYKEGYFGFRTTISHQQFENFKVYQL
ncbi:MAG: DUF6250 domain-containing protein [Paludibacter sp.]